MYIIRFTKQNGYTYTFIPLVLKSSHHTESDCKKKTKILKRDGLSVDNGIHIYPRQFFTTNVDITAFLTKMLRAKTNS